MFRRLPARHDRAERRRERLDPVRWGRPQRGALLRAILATLLLTTSAALLWYQPAPPEPSPTPTATGSPAGAKPPADRKDSAVPEGKVGVPVRLADPTALTLVRPGQRVDLLRPGEVSTHVASAALVLEVTGADDPTTGGLLLALSPGEAVQAMAVSGEGFAILIRPG